MQKNRKRLVIFALVTAIILSCGIPTSMPILPKEVAIKGSPSVSVPLGQVNYNLYSGLSGGKNATGVGSLDNLLGASWLTDLEEQGVKVYDYRPAGSAEDSIQKFLLHYKLNMEDTLGGAGEIDMSEYGGMLKDLTGGKPEPIKNNVEDIEIPSVNMTQNITVNIPLDGVTNALSANSAAFNAYVAVLPVKDGTETSEFPKDILSNTSLPNNHTLFLGHLGKMESLTFHGGKLSFSFKLKYNSTLSPPSGSTLKLSNFKLQVEGKDIQHTTSSPTVELLSDNAIGTGWIKFGDASGDTELFDNFELACDLEINGSGSSGGFTLFDLEITPSFKNIIISGVKKMELEPSQIAELKNSTSLSSEHSIRDNPDDPPGDSFHATVKEGNLTIEELFPPLGDDPTKEGWNLKINLEHLSIKQNNSSTGAEGLSLDGLPRDRLAKPNNLSGESFNNQPVKITADPGEVTMVIDDGGDGNLLTFQNYLINMSGSNLPYDNDLIVTVDVSLFSTVTALGTDLNLNPDQTNQTITQNISDFASYKDWLNYVEFAKGGLGANLTIGTLNTVGGLALYLDINEFDLHVHRPLINDSTGQNQNGANLNLTNDEEDGHRIWGKDLPADGNLRITVRLGLADPDAQQIYENTKDIGGLMTITDVVPGKQIELLNMTAGLVFNWDHMSVVPKEPIEGETKNEDLPDYPFTGSFPEADEDGLDLSAMPKELAFYIPGAEDEDGDVMTASLYISLKRQRLDGDVWVDEEADDPEGEEFVILDPHGWGRNLRVNLPDLNFKVRYGNEPEEISQNLFSYDPRLEKDTGQWALARSLNLEAPEYADLVKGDAENTHNPFKIYSGAALPEPGKAIPLGHLAEEFNKNLLGGKDLYFEYEITLASVKDDEAGNHIPGEIILYPEMLNKKVVASADLLMVLPLRFRARQPNTDTPEAPVTIVIAPDLGDGDLFGRGSPTDNGFFDFVTSLGFDTSIKNMLGLKTGAFYLESKTGGDPDYYRVPSPILDFTKPQNRFTLGSGEMETIKGIYPFIPQVAVEFAPGAELAIQRNFNIELQSITVKASGEYTFETGW